MFDQEYENPMVLGDYGDEDEQPQEVYCKHCGRLWTGYDCGEATEWDCTDDAYVSSFVFPLSADGRCRACAWEERTIEQERAYITATNCFVEVLEYLLCNRSVHRITHYDNAEILWDVLFNSEDDIVRSWVNDLIHDYIHDEMRSDFVDWLTEGGFDRVCGCCKDDE